MADVELLKERATTGGHQVFSPGCLFCSPREDGGVKMVAATAHRIMRYLGVRAFETPYQVYCKEPEKGDVQSGEAGTWCRQIVQQMGGGDITMLSDHDLGLTGVPNDPMAFS